MKPKRYEKRSPECDLDWYYKDSDADVCGLGCHDGIFLEEVQQGRSRAKNMSYPRDPYPDGKQHARQQLRRIYQTICMVPSKHQLVLDRYFSHRGSFYAPSNLGNIGHLVLLAPTVHKLAYEANTSPSEAYQRALKEQGVRFQKRILGECNRMLADALDAYSAAKEAWYADNPVKPKKVASGH